VHLEISVTTFLCDRVFQLLSARAQAKRLWAFGTQQAPGILDAMSVELQALRTAKAAVDEGLMQPTDYDAVKEAFVRALAIKGGVDSGFLGQADFADARKEFFQSLGMTSLGGGSGAGTMAPAPPVPTSAAHPPATTPTAPVHIARNPSVPQTNGISNSANLTPNRPAQRAVPAPRPPVPQLSIPDTQGSTAETTPTGIGLATPQGTVSTPGSISDRGGGAAAVAAKVRCVSRMESAWSAPSVADASLSTPPRSVSSLLREASLIRTF
jgi:hypothetical protein